MFMTLRERAHALFLRRLATQIEEPVLRPQCRSCRHIPTRTPCAT